MECNLPGNLIIDSPAHRRKRVHVLYFDLGSELGVPDGPDGNIDVAAEGTFLHVPIADPQVPDDPLYLGGVLGGLHPGPHVGVGDDLQQGDPGPVEVDLGEGGGGGAGVGVGMHELAGVLLHVDPGDPEGPAASSVLEGEVEAEGAGGGDGEVELGDLVALGEVRVEVLLAVELGAEGDGAVEGEGDGEGGADEGGVEGGEGARVPEAHRADGGVRRGAVGVRARAEGLGAGGQLHVGLDADHRLELVELLLGGGLWPGSVWVLEGGGGGPWAL